MCRTGSRIQQLQVVTEVLGKAGNPEKYAVIGKLQSKSGNRFAKLEVVKKLGKQLEMPLHCRRHGTFFDILHSTVTPTDCPVVVYAGSDTDRRQSQSEIEHPRRIP